MDAEKKIIRLIKLWTIPNAVEALLLIILLLTLAGDPKNAWLFGYSKTRVLTLGLVLLYVLALLFVYRLFSPPSKQISQSLQKIKSYPSINYIIEIACGFCLLLLFSGIFYFFYTIPLNRTLEAIHIRLIPIIVFTCLVITQIFLFLILFRLTIEREKFTLRNILHYGSLPTIRKKITLRKILHHATFPTIREKTFRYCDNTMAWLANKLNKSLLTFIFIFTPAIMTFALIGIIFRTTPLSFIPARSDPLYYWHQTLTFVEHGFSGGIYTLYGEPPLADFSAFGFHGPGYPVLYGLLGRIVGWEYYSGVLINLFFVTLALFFFTRLSKFNNKQLLTGILFISTYWPVLLYLSDNMIESINHAIAIVLAALFFKQLDSQESDWKTNTAIFLILLGSIPFRVTWSLLFFPFFFLLISNFRGYKALGAIVLSTAGVLLSFLYTKYFYNPGPDTLIFRAAVHGQLNIQEMLGRIGTQVHINIQNLIDELDTPLFIQVFRYQITGMSIFIVFKLIRYFKKQTRAIKGLVRSELMFHFFNIVVPFASVLFIYHVADTRDYRNLAHSFLLSMLLLLLFSRYKYVYPIVLINMLLIYSFIPEFTQKRSLNFIYDQEQITSFSNSVSEYVKFDETQSNRWCNTLGFNGRYQMPLVEIEPGIGLSRVYDLSKDTNPKYLLLANEYVAEFQTYIDSLGLQKLENTNIGVLYLNSNSDCETLTK